MFKLVKAKMLKWYHDNQCIVIERVHYTLRLIYCQASIGINLVLFSRAIPIWTTLLEMTACWIHLFGNRS